MTFVIIVLAIGLVVEGFIATVLNDWKGSLDAQQRRLNHQSRNCFACATGASVTSFSVSSSITFCPEHRAHFNLIRDLERKALDDGSPDD